jgi:peptidyl-prolyl cis-trans isomerase C
MGIGSLAVARAAEEPKPAATAAPATPATPAVKAADLFPDPVVAKGKGLEIKRSQLDADVVRAKSMYNSRQQPAPSDLDAQVLERLVGFQLIMAKATPEDRAAGKELFEKNIQRAKTEAKLTDKEFNDKLAPQLLLQNLTREEWDKQQIDQTTVPVVLKRELKVSASDEEAKKFYDENPSKFEQPEMVRASHVLISTRDNATNSELSEEKKKEKRKLAEDILKRARAGEDFAKLAKDYSDDPGSKDKGGEYTFPRGQMVPEFETAAFSLKTNEVSDIVTTQFGYHIIKLSEKMPAKKMELAKVSSDIKDYLSQQELQSKIPDYITKLKADANLEILDPKLKLKEFPDAANPPSAHPLPTPATKADAKSGSK